MRFHLKKDDQFWTDLFAGEQPCPSP